MALTAATFSGIAARSGAYACGIIHCASDRSGSFCGGQRVKLADISGGKSNHIVDFWAKFPLPDYPQIRDIPVTVIASVKRYDTPAHLLHTDRGRELWGKHWKEWAAAFPQGKAVLTSNSYHLIPQDEPHLVVAEARDILKRVRVNKSP